MIRSFTRAATLGLVALGAAVVAQPAFATAFTFDLAAKSSAKTSSLEYTAYSGTESLTLDVTGYHLNDTSSTKAAVVDDASVQTWAGYGLGVLYGSDRESNGTHQIDNVGGGVDFVALSFSTAVTLSDIERVAWGISGYGSNSDASFMAYTGDLASLSTLNEAGFTSLASGDMTTDSSATSKIWLVAANVARTDRDDGFKLTTLDVSTPAAVPEPASWAMMIAGFGGIGTALRGRRRTRGAAIA